MNTWIIPMAGKGTRTQSLGEFKPFVEINNHKILFWFLLSIKHLIKDKDKIIFITTSYFSKKFNVKLELEKLFSELNFYNEFVVIETPRDTKGQSDTLTYAEKIVDKNKPLIVANPDQYIDFDLPKTIECCYLTLYLQLGNKSGFVSIKNGLITNFVEKKNISNLAFAGVYIIAKAKWLFDAIEKQIKNKEVLNKEFYLGLAFNHIIDKSIKVKPLTIRAKYDLGNIEDIMTFKKSLVSQFLSLNRD